MESKMRIAVCDDEQAIADLVGQLLVEAGFVPTVFYAAPDLLACQADDPFDLVILDIMMPGMDGFACCRELRRTSSVPIIFLTAKDEEVDKVVGFELGADDYVGRYIIHIPVFYNTAVHPFLLVSLIDSIQHILSTCPTYFLIYLYYKFCRTSITFCISC